MVAVNVLSEHDSDSGATSCSLSCM